ncbi:hypothetical protein ACFSR7_35780 [Cohnella sp. GCM10020058]
MDDQDEIYEGNWFDDEFRFDPCVWDAERIEATKRILFAEFLDEQI